MNIDNYLMPYSSLQAKGNSAKGSVLFITDCYGIDDLCETHAEVLSSNGFDVYIPDIFWRIKQGIVFQDNSEVGRQKASERLFQFFGTERVVWQDIRDLVEKLEINSPLLVVGVGVGARIAFHLNNCREFVGGCGFYMPHFELAIKRIAVIETPFLSFFPEQDQRYSLEDVTALQRFSNSQDKLHIEFLRKCGYDFIRPNADNFCKKNTQVCWSKVIYFLRKCCEI